MLLWCAGCRVSLGKDLVLAVAPRARAPRRRSRPFHLFHAIFHTIAVYMLPLVIASAALNPVDAATLQVVSICAGNIRVEQDPRFSTVLPNQAQTLPLRCVCGAEGISLQSCLSFDGGCLV